MVITRGGNMFMLPSPIVLVAALLGASQTTAFNNRVPYHTNSCSVTGSTSRCSIGCGRRELTPAKTATTHSMRLRTGASPHSTYYFDELRKPRVKLTELRSQLRLGQIRRHMGRAPRPQALKNIYPRRPWAGRKRDEGCSAEGGIYLGRGVFDGAAVRAKFRNTTRKERLPQTASSLGPLGSTDGERGTTRLPWGAPLNARRAVWRGYSVGRNAAVGKMRNRAFLFFSRLTSRGVVSDSYNHRDDDADLAPSFQTSFPGLTSSESGGDTPPQTQQGRGIPLFRRPLQSTALPSNPIARFAVSNSIAKSPAGLNRRPFSGSSITETFVMRDSNNGAITARGGSFTPHGTTAELSLLGRLTTRLRSRASSTQEGEREVGAHAQHTFKRIKINGGENGLGVKGLDRYEGLSELCAAISRVETKLSADSSEATQLRESLTLLRFEKEAYEKERAKEAARVEAMARAYDDMRRRASVTKAELSRSDRRIKNAEAEREIARKALNERVGQLARGFGLEKQQFARDVKAAETGGNGDIGAMVVGEITREYHARVRAISDSLLSTQKQLEMLKHDRDKENRAAEKTRKQLTREIAQLEALLQRSGDGVDREKAEMETVLRRLSSALDGVDVELAQSAGMTPSRETGRALRKAQEDFRKDQRDVKTLLVKLRRRYETTILATEAGAQRLRARTLEMHDLRAGLAESVGKERNLKSSVASLGGRISSLDKELRQMRDALSNEQELREQAEHALLSVEELRQQETVRLQTELAETRESMGTTRKVYEHTVGQRAAWQRAIGEEERARREADSRAEAAESARHEEVDKNRRDAKAMQQEIASLKAQVVKASKSLAMSEEEREAETEKLGRRVEKLMGEARRLEAQAEEGKRVVARTVSGVSNTALRNASAVSQVFAPQGLVAKMGERFTERFRPANAPPFIAGGAASQTADISPSHPDLEARLGSEPGKADHAAFEEGGRGRALSAVDALAAGIKARTAGLKGGVTSRDGVSSDVGSTGTIGDGYGRDGLDLAAAGSETSSIKLPNLDADGVLPNGTHEKRQGGRENSEDGCSSTAGLSSGMTPKTGIDTGTGSQSSVASGSPGLFSKLTRAEHSETKLNGEGFKGKPQSDDSVVNAALADARDTEREARRKARREARRATGAAAPSKNTDITGVEAGGAKEDTTSATAATSPVPVPEAEPSGTFVTSIFPVEAVKEATRAVFGSFSTDEHTTDVETNTDSSTDVDGDGRSTAGRRSPRYEKAFQEEIIKVKSIKRPFGGILARPRRKRGTEDVEDSNGVIEDICSGSDEKESVTIRNPWRRVVNLLPSLEISGAAKGRFRRGDGSDQLEHPAESGDDEKNSAARRDDELHTPTMTAVEALKSGLSRLTRKTTDTDPASGSDSFRDEITMRATVEGGMITGGGSVKVSRSSSSSSSSSSTGGGKDALSEAHFLGLGA